MKLKLLGTAVIFTILTVAPAIAQHVHSKPGRHALSAYCATREPGNPYSAKSDYMTWSAWRRLGAWDSRGDARPPPVADRR